MQNIKEITRWHRMIDRLGISSVSCTKLHALVYEMQIVAEAALLQQQQTNRSLLSEIQLT